MKILQIAPQILPVPPSLGGAIEDGIYRVALLLSKDHKIHVISRIGTISEQSNIKFKHVNFSFYEKVVLSYFYNFRNHLSSKIRSLLKYPYAYKIKNKINEYYDIIHIRNLTIAYPFIAKATKKSKIILHLHNDLLKQRKIKRIIYRTFINKYDLFIYVSDYLRQKTLRYYPELAEKSIVLHNGVDLDIYKPLDNSTDINTRNKLNLKKGKILLYAGRIIPSKGVIYLIKAFNEIIKKNKNVKLIITGSREFKLSKDDKYVKLVKKTANKNVIFTGFLKHNELRKIYSISDIFIYPPVWEEPFGKAVLEAMATKTAIIATRSGGIPEIIADPKQGFIVEKRNYKAIAEAVSKLLSNEKKLEEFKLAAYDRAQNFSWENVTKKLIKIYQELLKEKQYSS